MLFGRLGRLILNDCVDAALGKKIDVPTVYGEVEVEVPAGSQPNQILRLKGRGIKDMRRGTPGDQYIHFQIKTPTKLSKEQKKLLEEYQKSETKGVSFFDKFKKSLQTLIKLTEQNRFLYFV